VSLTTGEKILNRYRIQELIAEGGFGAIYCAWDEKLNKAVALKENQRFEDEFKRQFVREARLLANLHHDHLPRVSNYFLIEEQGQYLVMDFVEGRNLDTWLKQRGSPFTEAEIIDWLLKICDALTYLHTQQPPIVHRDVKPANIIITPQDTPMLVDFGIAAPQQTKTGASVSEAPKAMTHGFSPPEQYYGKTEPRSDIYALGATIYNLLTGERPSPSLSSEGRAEMMARLQALNPAIAAIIATAISLDLEQRFATVAELRTALRKAVQPEAMTTMALPLSGQVATKPAVKLWSQLPLWPWGMGALLLSAILLYVGVTLRGNRVQIADANSLTLTWQATPNRPAATQLIGEVATGGVTMEPSEVPGRLVVPEGSTPVTRPPRPATITPTPASTVSLPTATPAPPAGATRVVDLPSGLQAAQVFVPAGTFMMGSQSGDANAEVNEYPRHEVALDGFWLDQTEVTNAQFASFLSQEGNQAVEFWGRNDNFWLGPTEEISEAAGHFEPIEGYDNYPVTHISWFGAKAYCEWAGGRLPTEAEWEYAARGPDSLTYPWGNELPTCDLANVFPCGEVTAKVGQYPSGASWVGALDMNGNVNEWVYDWYDPYYYGESPYYNPTGPDRSSVLAEPRVVRGSSVLDNGLQSRRSSYRHWNIPADNMFLVGVRCAAEE